MIIGDLSRIKRLRPRSITLLLFVGAIELVGLFAKIADEMREGETNSFDNSVLNALRDGAGQPIGPPWMSEAARDITSLGSYAVLAPLVVLVVLYLLLSKRRFEAAYLAGSVTLGVIVSNLLKIGFNRPRPPLDNTPEVFTASFPSGHATMSAVVFLTLGAILWVHDARRPPRVLFITTAVALAVVVGASRVYLGVHYPTDVLAGWCLGTAWAIGCVLVAQRFSIQVRPSRIAAHRPQYGHHWPHGPPMCSGCGYHNTKR